MSVRIHTVVLTQERDGMVEALWLSSHATSGTKAVAEDPIAALRALAVELEQVEEYRASLPD